MVASCEKEIGMIADVDLLFYFYFLYTDKLEY